MKAKEAIEIFRTLYDRYGSEEGITDYEASRAINDASLLTMKFHFRPNMGKYHNSIDKDPTGGFEATTYDSEDFQPLLYNDLPATASTIGVVSKSSLMGTFPDTTVYNEDGTITEQTKTEIFHILDVSRYNGADFYLATWMRHNELKTAMNNSFTAPSSACPAYKYTKDGLQLYPTGARNVKVSLVRHPKMMWWMPDVGISVDPEFGRSIMMDIIERAVRLAAMAVRDSEAYQFIQSEIQDS